MTFATTAYAYPWDIVGDPDGAKRLTALGTDSVTIAAAYHSVRAATPRHPEHRIVHASAAALYLPVREGAWRGRRLVPQAATEWAGDDSFARARDAANGVGLRAAAWVVLTHSSALGASAPDLCVTSAFGDRYTYALCPSSGEVREYATTLAGEVAAQAEVESMVVEGCGQLGASHQSQHEKTAGADWTAVDDALLSICFCAACFAAYDERGIDPVPLATQVRSVVGVGAPDLADAIGDAAAGILAVRTKAAVGLRDAVTEAAAAGGVAHIEFHASTDPWATGPSPAIVDDQGAARSFIAQCWSGGSDGVTRVAEMVAAVGGASGVGAYCTILPPIRPDAADLAASWQTLIRAGADSLHLYHAGLASSERLERAAESLALLRISERPPKEEEPTP